MKKELDEQLCSEFPLLYRHRGGDIHEHPMAWGFPGDGWFNILQESSKKIEKVIKKYAEENPGKDLPASAQVKNKFGILRWYINYPKDIPASVKNVISTCVAEAEEASEFICESCGIGKLRTEGFSSRCKKCEQDRERNWQ